MNNPNQRNEFFWITLVVASFLLGHLITKNQYLELLEFCNAICENVGNIINANVKCIRGDSFSTPKVIHRDIWAQIQMADALIADVSGTNGNVMIELGVAAAIREKEQVIVIHEEETKHKFLFTPS